MAWTASSFLASMRDRSSRERRRFREDAIMMRLATSDLDGPGFEKHLPPDED